jgi:hypothetical protein
MPVTGFHTAWRRSLSPGNHKPLMQIRYFPTVEGVQIRVRFWDRVMRTVTERDLGGVLPLPHPGQPLPVDFRVRFRRVDGRLRVRVHYAPPELHAPVSGPRSSSSWLGRPSRVQHQMH